MGPKYHLPLHQHSLRCVAVFSRMAPPTLVSQEVYLLPLNDDGSPDVPGGYIYLTSKSDAPIIVRFAIEGTSSICRHGSLWVNIPAEGEEFQRDIFREFKYAGFFCQRPYQPNMSADSSRTSTVHSRSLSLSPLQAHLHSTPHTLLYQNYL